ncbi:MAG: glutathione S-transferase family protein [Rhodobacteraceae bacterium]|nr:glutathione S-transferase family protein [Paracoccaceae bacterium]
MSETIPAGAGLAELHIFSISHYCEKARWALEHLRIPHEINILAPGPHQIFAKKHGLRRGSLPILTLADGTVVQGSSAILDWAERHKPADAPSLAPDPTHAADAEAAEQRLDKVLGVHARRHFYSEAMVEHPGTVKPIFAEGLSPWRKLLLGAMWGGLRKLMIKGMDLGPEQRIESRDKIAAELDWLDGLLAGGRGFLFGDRLSRADISAAALMSPLILPPEHPIYAEVTPPPKVKADCAAWAERPSMRWAAALYRDHRRPAG